MARFRNVRTGSIVNVPSLPVWDDWESLDETPDSLVVDEREAEGEESSEGDVEQDPVLAPIASEDGRPSASASRKDWAKFAESLGIDPGYMTRGELIAAVDAL